MKVITITTITTTTLVLTRKASARLLQRRRAPRGGERDNLFAERKHRNGGRNNRNGENENENNNSNNPSPNPNDLNIRFNKIAYVDGVELPNSPLLMEDEDYPLSEETALWLSQTLAVSVVRHQTCGECDIPTDELIRVIGGPPSHPSRDPNDPYWEELREVVEAQEARLQNVLPVSVLKRVPAIWFNFDIEDVAAAVHDEFPGIHHVDLLEQLLAEGATVNRDIIPSPNYVEFLRGPVMLSDLNTWCIATVGPHNFGAKWYVGRARPEEVALMIREGDIPDAFVPSDIVDKLANEFQFDTAEAFTAYPEGSPKHPSWPAMHSAASAGSLWIPLVLDLTPEQVCEVRAVDYGVAYARTVAGVHYPSDNIDGLNLGQEILARKLPEYLADRYGSDPILVKERIDDIRFDWNSYLDSDCITNQMMN